MVPLGLASSGAVRVGHAMGAGRVDRARLAGWTALGVGAAVMTMLGLLLFLLLHQPLLVFFVFLLEKLYSKKK